MTAHRLAPWALDLDARLTLPTAAPGSPPAIIPATGVRRGCACGAIPRDTSLPAGAVCATLMGALAIRRRRAGRA